MNALVFLMALLGVSYLAGLLGRGRSVRGMGLPSGIEWVALGVILGPSVLAVIDGALQRQVEPAAQVAIGWLSFVLGLDFGVVRRRRLSFGRAVMGVAVGAGTAAAVGGAVWFAIPSFIELGADDRLLLSLGLAAVLTETTANAVRWVAERHGAHGPLSQLLADLAEAKDLVPILTVGVAICWRPSFAWPLPLPAVTLTAALVVLGAILGAVAAVLLRHEQRAEQSWGVLLGTSVLGVGVTARLGLPVPTVLFAMGWLLGALSRRRDQLTHMVDPTQRPALLPALILAGARVEPPLLARLGGLIGVALAARLVLLLMLGSIFGSKKVGARGLLGLGMLSTGDLSIGIGLIFALRFPTGVGPVVLTAAACGALFGELVGPAALRLSLKRAGELEAQAQAESAGT